MINGVMSIVVPMLWMLCVIVPVSWIFLLMRWAYTIIKNMYTIQNKTENYKLEFVCFFFVPYYSLYWWYTRVGTLKMFFAENGCDFKGNRFLYIFLELVGLRFLALAILQGNLNHYEKEKNYKLIKTKIDVTKIVLIGVFCALSYIAMMFVKIPVVLFLKYEPKDVIITICGLIYGPLSSFVVSVIVSFIEMISVSETGIIGFLMNVISTCTFSCTAALVYKKGKNIKSAVAGLVVGTLVMTTAMILWNYIITPLYMNVSRQQVIGLLVPAFLPFNLVKGSLNAALTYLLYKPVVKILRQARLVPKNDETQNKKTNVPLVVVSFVVLVSAILAILALKGII